MRQAEALRRAARRSDVRAVLAIAGLLFLAISLQGVLLFAYIAEESLEEADRWMHHLRETTRRELTRGESAEIVIEDLEASLPDVDLSVRLVDPAGKLLRSWGAWPAPQRQVAAADVAAEDPRRLSEFGWLRRGSHLVDRLELPSGGVVELALPLSHSAFETAEIGVGLALFAAFSAAAALAIAAFATHRAFAPLRAATRLVGDLDARRLGRRLPTRGTADPVDLHAETLNEVLGAIDAAFARLRAFSSDVAHELRTPLNRIGTVAEVALLSREEPELRTAIERIRSSADELSRVVQSLLLLAELDEGRIVQRRATLDVDAWIAQTAEAYGPLLEERGVKLTVRSEAGSLLADRTLLDRVLVNLLDNALEHTGAGDRVELQAVRGGNWLVVSLDDSGAGIPEERREHVFDRFARLDRARRETGRGLGLAIARAAARLLGGDLIAEESPLGGARFAWKIPAAGSPEPS